jgi:hypothetical protein
VHLSERDGSPKASEPRCMPCQRAPFTRGPDGVAVRRLSVATSIVYIMAQRKKEEKEIKRCFFFLYVYSHITLFFYCF